jgi:hypothetical protein
MRPNMRKASYAFSAVPAWFGTVVTQPPDCASSVGCADRCALRLPQHCSAERAGDHAGITVRCLRPLRPVVPQRATASVHDRALTSVTEYGAAFRPGRAVLSV